MANTKVFYQEVIEDIHTGKWKSRDLCFICAVQSSREKIPGTTFNKRISLQTTGYEHEKCDGCGEFIRDEVEI